MSLLVERIKLNEFNGTLLNYSSFLLIEDKNSVRIMNGMRIYLEGLNFLGVRVPGSWSHSLIAFPSCHS